MASWPAGLPNPNGTGYTLEPISPFVRTDMEVGAARSRRRTFARNDALSLSWTFTDAQMATFRAWFENSSTGINGGASWFTVSVPVGNTGFSSLEARFMEMYKAAQFGQLFWTVSAKIELR